MRLKFECWFTHRECLDWMVPLSESHLHTVVNAWMAHYNRELPHMALGPGIPDPPPGFPNSSSRHRCGESYSVHAQSILSGLHHEHHIAAA